jgi:hypothetical protein
MHEMLASLAEHQQAPYSPPLVHFDSTYTRSDLWRAIPLDKQTLYQRKGDLPDVKPVATDGTHFLAFCPFTGKELVGHVTNLIESEKLFAPPKTSKPNTKKPRKARLLDEVLCEL